MLTLSYLICFRERPGQWVLYIRIRALKLMVAFLRLIQSQPFCVDRCWLQPPYKSPPQLALMYWSPMLLTAHLLDNPFLFFFF